MKDINEHNKTIDDINSYVDILLSEGLPPIPIWLMDKLGRNIPDISDWILGNDVEGVILDKDGNPIASVDKDEVEIPDEEETEEEEEVEDVFGQSEEDKELIRQAKDAIAATDAMLALSLPAGAMTVTKGGKVLNKQGEDISTIKVFFKGNNNLSVVIGGGDKIEQNFSGFMDFDVQTIKKTGRGYIMNLVSPKMRRDASLLLYVKNLDKKPQTNLGQLAYNKGKFIGDPKQMSFEIVKVK